jgi:transcriptional regulator with XRE-family HTH domain
MRKQNTGAGEKLRALRLQRGLAMRDVQEMTKQLAKQKRNPKLTISPSRLSDLENEQVKPNIYRMYALSVAYKCPVKRLLDFYGLR